MAAGSRLNLMSSYESYARAVQRPTRLLKIETLGSVFHDVLILLKNPTSLYRRPGFPQSWQPYEVQNQVSGFGK